MNPAAPNLDELLDGLASGVLPEQLPGWDRACTALPIFDLCRALFSKSPADTALKLVLLLTLSKVEGRFSRERIRALVPHLQTDKLDLLITSLYSGGWLQLRATDHTYRLPPLAFFLLNLLVAADFAGQTPANMLIRAVETVAFGGQIDAESTGHLLAMLQAELETQAEAGRRLLASGSARQLIRFSRQEVRHQLEHVGQVISAIEARTQASSEHFARLVRIHEAMQVILRTHEGLGRRLAEWNLKRLETSDAGYSLAVLSDATLGASDAELHSVLHTGILSVPAPTSCLVTRRLLTRYRTTRRAMAREREAFAYQAPPEPEINHVRLAEVDPVERVRARVQAALQAGACVTRALLADTTDFMDAVYQLSLLARIEGRVDPADGTVELAPGVRVRLDTPAVAPALLHGLNTQAALDALIESGHLITAGPRGLHPKIEVIP
jgi:hypothetical protein